jgi:type IV pilus assembly protein PilQ
MCRHQAGNQVIPSGGHSPAQVKRKLDITDYQQQIEADNVTIKQRPLPTRIISMKMRNTEVKAILRAMAQAAGINILLKDDIKGVTTVDINGVPWNQVFVSLLKSYGLSYAWEGDVIRVLSEADMDRMLKDEMLNVKMAEQAMLAKNVGPLSMVMIPINYIDAKILSVELQEFIPKDKDGKAARGFVRAEEHTNSIIIQATRADIDRLVPIIELIDQPRKQINIRANIIETTKSMARELGIQWGGMFKKRLNSNNLWVTPGSSPTSTGTGTITDPVTGGYTPALGNPGLSGQGFGVNFPASGMQTVGGAAALGLMYGTLGGNILELQLQALQQDGKINIISSPSITTLDNSKAYVKSGEKVPYVSTSTSGGSTSQTVQFVDAVLSLEIVPHIIDGKNLKMEIVLKKDEVDMSQAVQGNPLITTKETRTRLIIEDGETIVISGLTKQNTTNTNTGVPGLKDIPLLGWLFKGESRDDTTQEVLIFITPHILPQKTADVSKDSTKE